MDQVSISILKTLGSGISEIKGVSLDQLVEGSNFPDLAQRKASEWTDWNQMVEWMLWIETRWAPIDWIEVGRRSIGPKHIPAVAPIFRAMVSVRFAYWLAAKWFGPSQFRVITCDFKDVAPNHVRETLEISSDLRPCLQIFEVFIGTLSMFAESMYNLPRARVESAISGHRGVYDVFLPQQKAAWQRILRTFTNFKVLGHLFSELAKTQTALTEQTVTLVRERSDFKQMIAQFPDGILIHRGGKILYLNERMLSYLNYPDSSFLIGKSCVDLVVASQRSTVEERIGATVKSGKVETKTADFAFVKYNSEEIFESECTSMSTSFEGAPAVVTIVRDISDRKKHESLLLETDRLSSLALLAAGIGHEINNPLFYVMMKLEWVREALKDKIEASVAKELHEIGDGLIRIQSIVKGLKALSRGHDAESAVPIDLGSSLRTAISMAGTEIQQRAALVVSISDLPPILANEAPLGQVFLNLLINAAQAIELGKPEKNQISVEAFTEGEKVVVKISDSGPGISDSVKKNLFKPFFTTKPIGQGTGLGLSICQSIVNRYKGQISVDSELGKGTTFTLSFDSTTPAPEILVAKKNTFEPSKTKRGRVLIIDDDEILLETLALIVGANHEAIPTSSATDALVLIRQGQRFDAIICDLMMPELGGAEFYDLLQGISPKLCKRIVFFTGGIFTKVTNSFLNKPGIRYCQKPIHNEDLHKLLNEIVSQSLREDVN